VKSSSLQKIGIIVIAAGNSSRLGQPKQLVEIAGVSLLQNTINLAEQLSENSVCVVGFDADKFKSSLEVSTTKILVNKNWQQGMGCSIACAVKYFTDEVDAVMILLCDQYRLTEADLGLLIERWQRDPDKIVASQYFEIKCNSLIEGAPAIFPKQYFGPLMALKEKGARDILSKNQENVIAVLLENAASDLDTKDDLKLLISLSPVKVEE